MQRNEEAQLMIKRGREREKKKKQKAQKTEQYTHTHKKKSNLIIQIYFWCRAIVVNIDSRMCRTMAAPYTWQLTWSRFA